MLHHYTHAGTSSRQEMQELPHTYVRTSLQQTKLPFWYCRQHPTPQQEDELLLCAKFHHASNTGRLAQPRTFA